jgi:hypothetical protein
MRSNERDRLIDIIRLHNQKRCRQVVDTRRQFALRAVEIVVPTLTGIAGVVGDYALGLEATVRFSGGPVTFVLADAGVDQELLHRSQAHLQPPPRQLQELTAHNVTGIVISHVNQVLCG